MVQESGEFLHVEALGSLEHLRHLKNAILVEFCQLCHPVSMYEAHALAKELADEQKKEERLARMTALEDEVYETATQVVLAGIAFHEVSPTQPEPPQAWIDIYGYDAAMRRLRVAQAMWMPKSQAPAGLDLAQKAMTGISRGRAFRVRLTQNQLNVKIELPAPTSAEHPGPETYKVLDIE